MRDLQINTPWPHQFTKNGKGYEIGRDELNRPTYAQTYICVHCLIEFVQGVEARPMDSCPARNNKREMKRILLS